MGVLITQFLILRSAAAVVHRIGWGESRGLETCRRSRGGGGEGGVEGGYVGRGDEGGGGLSVGCFIGLLGLGGGLIDVRWVGFASFATSSSPLSPHLCKKSSEC